MFINDVKEAREVLFNDEIDLVLIQGFTDSSVSGYIEKQVRNFQFDLVEGRGIRVFIDYFFVPSEEQMAGGDRGFDQL